MKLSELEVGKEYQLDLGRKGKKPYTYLGIDMHGRPTFSCNVPISRKDRITKYGNDIAELPCVFESSSN